MRPLADWPATPACVSCGQPTEQYHPPPRSERSIAAIVVYRAPDGTFRFPGDGSGAQAARYASQGFERVELRGAADVRRFEKVMNAHEYSRAMRRVEVRQAQREARERETRSELRQRMQSFTRFGREVAKAAMTMNDNKPRLRAADPNFHSEVFSYDRSNREESRDERGRRRRD
jgi:hypothetical protein